MSVANWDNIHETELEDAIAGKIKWTRNMPGHYQAKVVVLVEGMGGAQRLDENGISCGMQIVTFEAELVESGYDCAGLWHLRVCTNGREFTWLDTYNRFKDCKRGAVRVARWGFIKTEFDGTLIR